MDVDMPLETLNIESKSVNSMENDKFEDLKTFVTIARDFESSHSENSINLMNRHLGIIASTCDLTIFSPGRLEVCSFFSSLWRVMCDSRAPHWACLAVLERAAAEPNARYALTHTYKFLPILSRLLSDSISNEKKYKLLSVMQDVSYGIKISWQESYLPNLMEHLTKWILEPMSQPQATQQRLIGHKSLAVLVNVCYGNLPAIYTLTRTVDTKDFVMHFINLKEGSYGAIEVCRLLVCLSGVSKGSAVKQADVHSYLCCTMRTFKKAIVEHNSSQLLHAYIFINDLCSDNNLRNFVQTYPHFGNNIKDSIQSIEELCGMSVSEENDSIAECILNTLKFLIVLMGLDLYYLRSEHPSLLHICVLGSRVCLPEALELFAAIVLQYRDEGGLPQDLIEVLSDGLSGLLVPTLDPSKGGLQWIQVVCALSETPDTRQRIYEEVSINTFESTLYGVLQHFSQNGSRGVEQSQQAVLLSCRTCLTLAPNDKKWEDALNRILAYQQVRKYLCQCLSSNKSQKRRQVLQLIKHHYFPSDQMNQVFGENNNNLPSNDSGIDISNAEHSVTNIPENCWQMCLSVAQEHAIDQLIDKLNKAFEYKQITDIATSSVMELYKYKMTCLEQRLHSHTAALQGATEQVACLQHTVAMLQATNSSQLEVLYDIQTINEKYKNTIELQERQFQDAEKTFMGVKAKLAAVMKEKQDLAQVMKLENANIQKEAEERIKAVEQKYVNLQTKLDQQTNKNKELAGVLMKFEERVKQRDKKLEEASHLESNLRKEIDQKDLTIKQLEKTVLERENKLYQLTTQLDEMKRVQEMVSKLVSKSTAAS